MALIYCCALLTLTIAPCYGKRSTLVLLAHLDPYLQFPTKLTQNLTGSESLIWSPDGTRIAFVSQRDDNYDVYVVDANGGLPINLTQRRSIDWSPVWSPDGRRIAFESWRDGKGEIYVVGADGGVPANLTRHFARDGGPAWSPDGTRIAFESWRDGNGEIYVVDADGGNLLNLTRDPGPDESPVWSPDGRRIAFVSRRAGNGEIYVVDADGGNLTNLTSNPSNDWSPVWSPDGRRIAFTANRAGNGDIYVVDADGGNLTNLTPSPSNDWSPVWSPDGTRILHLRSEYRRIYVMDADGRNPADLGRGASPVWSPDGTRIAFVSERDDNIYAAEFVVPTWGALDTSVPHKFGYQWVGAVSEWTLIVHNPASAADTLRVEAVEVAPPYGVSMESFDLAPGGRQPLVVTYAPTQPGFSAQTLVLRSNAPEARIRLWGTAVPTAAKMTLSTSASFYDFGTVFARAGEAWTLEVGNTGRDTLRVEVITGLPFTAEPMAFTVPQGGRQAVRVLYHPLAAGRHLRPLALRSNDPNRPQVTISLRGQALDEQPEMRLDASGSYHFGAQRVGSVSAWTFTVSNAASAADTLRVSAVRVLAPFGVAERSFKVAPGGRHPVAVFYSPTALGTFAETLVIVSNDLHTPRYKLRLQGTTDRGPPHTELVLGIPVSLTPDLGKDSLFSWSPDGGRLAFVSARAGNEEIYTVDVNGDHLFNVTQHPAQDSSPAWSPDGGRLAFVSARAGNEEIYTVDVNGDHLFNVTQHPAQDSSPAWSPDGGRLAFISEHDGNRGLYVINADGDHRANLTQRPAWNDSPAWSPDGTRLAFQAYRYSAWDIYVVKAKGGSLTNLTQHGHYDGSPAWSPDGSRLAFRSRRDGNGEIYCMDADGGTLINLTRHPSDDRLPAWSPDGRYIAFVSDRSYRTNIHLVDAYAGLHITRLPWPAWPAAPAWSPDGTRIAFLADRDGVPKLSVVAVEWVGLPTSVEDAFAPPPPERFVLHPNAPNPFNPTTRIRYDVPQAAAVELVIYDMLGQRVIQLVGEAQSGGQHAVVWDGQDGSGRPVASGVYVYRLRVRPLAGGLPQTQTRRMVLLR